MPEDTTLSDAATNADPGRQGSRASGASSTANPAQEEAARAFLARNTVHEGGVLRIPTMSDAQTSYGNAYSSLRHLGFDPSNFENQTIDGRQFLVTSRDDLISPILEIKFSVLEERAAAIAGQDTKGMFERNLTKPDRLLAAETIVNAVEGGEWTEQVGSQGNSRFVANIKPGTDLEILKRHFEGFYISEDDFTITNRDGVLQISVNSIDSNGDRYGQYADVGEQNVRFKKRFRDITTTGSSDTAKLLREQDRLLSQLIEDNPRGGLRVNGDILRTSQLSEVAKSLDNFGIAYENKLGTRWVVTDPDGIEKLEAIKIRAEERLVQDVRHDIKANPPAAPDPNKVTLAQTSIDGWERNAQGARTTYTANFDSTTSPQQIEQALANLSLMEGVDIEVQPLSGGQISVKISAPERGVSAKLDQNGYVVRNKGHIVFEDRASTFELAFENALTEGGGTAPRPSAEDIAQAEADRAKFDQDGRGPPAGGGGSGMSTAGSDDPTLPPEGWQDDVLSRNAEGDGLRSSKASFTQVAGKKGLQALGKTFKVMAGVLPIVGPGLASAEVYALENKAVDSLAEGLLTDEQFLSYQGVLTSVLAKEADPLSIGGEIASELIFKEWVEREGIDKDIAAQLRPDYLQDIFRGGGAGEYLAGLSQSAIDQQQNEIFKYDKSGSFPGGMLGDQPAYIALRNPVTFETVKAELEMQGNQEGLMALEAFQIREFERLDRVIEGLDVGQLALARESMIEKALPTLEEIFPDGVNGMTIGDALRNPEMFQRIYDSDAVANNPAALAALDVVDTINIVQEDKMDNLRSTQTNPTMVADNTQDPSVARTQQTSVSGPSGMG